MSDLEKKIKEELGEDVLDQVKTDLEVIDSGDDEPATWKDLESTHENIAIMIGSVAIEIAGMLQNPEIAKAIQDKEEAVTEIQTVTRVITTLKDVLSKIYVQHKDKTGDIITLDDAVLSTKLMLSYQSLTDDITTTLLPSVTNLGVMISNVLEPVKEEEKNGD